MGGGHRWLSLLPFLVQGASSEIHSLAHPWCCSHGGISRDDVFPYRPGFATGGALPSHLPPLVWQRDILLYADDIPGGADAFPAFLHGTDDGGYHPQRSCLYDVFGALQFWPSPSDG